METITITVNDNARDLIRCAAIARERKLAVAINQGRGQLQRVTYNAKRTSQIEPLSDWLAGAELLAVVKRECL
jgi:hypothetical protein